jgi:hypothetical protein
MTCQKKTLQRILHYFVYKSCDEVTHFALINDRPKETTSKSDDNDVLDFGPQTQNKIILTAVKTSNLVTTPNKYMIL